MDGAGSPPELSGWGARLQSHLRSGPVSRVVYGSIIGLALVLTLEAKPSGPGTAAGTLVATAVAVGLAELYSEVLARHARVGLDGEAEPLREVLEDTVAVIFGVAFPALFFLLAAAGWIELDTAYRLAKWTGLGLIALYGYLGSRLGGSSQPHAVLRAAGVALIAALLILFKALVH